MLLSALFNICAFIINAINFQKAYLKPSAINTTSESRCRSKKIACPFSAYTYSSDGLQVEDYYSSRVMSDVNPSPVKSAKAEAVAETQAEAEVEAVKATTRIVRG